MRALRNAAKIGSVRPVVTLRKGQTLILLAPSTVGVEFTKENSVCLSICPSSFFPPTNVFLFFLLRFLLLRRLNIFLLKVFFSVSFSVFLFLHRQNIFLFQMPCFFSFSLARGRVWLDLPVIFLTFLKRGGEQTHVQKNCCKFVKAVWHKIDLRLASKWDQKTF